MTDAGTRREALREAPERFGFLALLREFERGAPDKPRIGRNATLEQEIVTLGQDPFLAFPDSNISSFAELPGRPPRLRARFLGYFGPQGALPLATTVEVFQWHLKRDDAFVRFADLFAGRFQQLFFRVWSDARAITQFDHGSDDRFQHYLGAVLGLASPALRGRGTVPDLAVLPVAGLAMGRVRSAVRLRQLLEEVLDVTIRVEEHMPMWMAFEPDDLTRLGMQGATLGRDARIGSRVQGVNEKIRLTVLTASVPQYESFLPGGSSFARLADLVRRYLGPEIEVEIAPALPADRLPAARLGGGSAGHGAALGWTAWMAPPPAEAGSYRSDAAFSAAHDPGQRAGA
ncbi:MAG: type VI secretion system baseplate subunit TssG [Defluviimonas sp.]|nr:type VI secretion system baseplate subunit TssG [Defluviimonas sp.]